MGDGMRIIKDTIDNLDDLIELLDHIGMLMPCDDQFTDCSSEVKLQIENKLYEFREYLKRVNKWRDGVWRKEVHDHLAELKALDEEFGSFHD
jgi:hypothetical protein